MNHETREVKLANGILDLVRSTEVGGDDTPADSGGIAMFGTYLQAYRRMSRIRDLALQGAAQEAFILLRSLLAMIARAVWLDQPVDADIRKARWQAWLKRQLEDEINEAEWEIQFGLEPPDDLSSLREQLSGLKGVPKMPDDRRLLVDELGLDGYYGGVYVPASGHVHYSLRSAIDEVRAAAMAGENLAFDRGEPELARRALLLSVVIYSHFLELSERTVHHGLGAKTRALIDESGVFEDEQTSSTA